MAQVRDVGAGLLVVINGSPYEVHKDDTRLELASQRAVEADAALAYVNMVGGQDELVFDGDSLVVGADGSLIARGPQFVEDLLVVDLDLRRGHGLLHRRDQRRPGTALRASPRAVDRRPAD